MSDLISRKDVVDALKQRLEDDYIDSYELLKYIKDLPSVEPKRKKGEWVDGLPYVNSHWWVCSICHVSAPENHTGYNFCPNCGADMRGE